MTERPFVRFDKFLNIFIIKKSANFRGFHDHWGIVLFYVFFVEIKNNYYNIARLKKN